VKHRQLVMEDKDLGILRNGVHPMQVDQPEGATGETLEERQGHQQTTCPSACAQVKVGGRVNVPFRLGTEDPAGAAGQIAGSFGPP
jgi:hypothetical protein